MNAPLDPAQLSHYVALLRRGGVVACPTETLLGLLADARDPEAVAKVVALKRRGDDAIALLLPDSEAVRDVAVEVSARARALMQRYWPGPLTLVLRARPGLPAPLAPHGTVGVRVPGPSPALQLVRAFGAPLTATSCNRSGQPPARSAAEARVQFGAALDAIVPGAAGDLLPSTVVDATGAALRVLRPGAIAIDAGA